MAKKISIGKQLSQGLKKFFTASSQEASDIAPGFNLNTAKSTKEVGFWNFPADTKGFRSAEGGVAPNLVEQRAAISARIKPTPHIIKEERKEGIIAVTSPNMLGFFPAYEPKDEHANFAITAFDTETADKNTDIIEIAGIKVIYNKTKKRFEQLPNTKLSTGQFYGLYNPSNARYVQTEQVHGRNEKMIMQLDNAIPGGWSKEDLDKFMSFASGTILSGHNILNADLPWIHGKPTGGFVYQEPTFKQGILDTLHLSAALFGKGHNALQELAKRFNVNDMLPGLPAHAGWADTVKQIKVFEVLLDKFSEHPAVQEFLDAMETGNRHSHYLENPDPLHNSGLVTHGITQSSKLGAIGLAFKKNKTKRRVKVKNSYVQDIPSALAVDPDDLYNGNVDLSSYEEMSMASTDKELQEELEYFRRHGVGGGGSGWSIQSEELLKAVAASAHWGRQAARSQIIRSIKGLSPEDQEYIIKTEGWSSEKEKLIKEAEILEEKERKKKSETAYESLERRAKRFAVKAELGGWASDQINEAIANHSLTEEILAQAEFEEKRDTERARQHQKDLDKQQAAQEAAAAKYEATRWKQSQQSQRFWANAAMQERLERRDLHKQSQSAYTQGYLFKGDLEHLNKVTQGTKAYREELEKLTQRNAAILSVTKKLNNIPLYDPMKLFAAVDAQYGGIRKAAHGILPGFLERPALRAGDALSNVWKQFEAGAKYKWSMLSMAGETAGTLAGGAAGSVFGPLGVMVGSNIGGFLGGATSQIVGGNAEKRITQLGQGIQHRLNLIGMVTSLFGGLADVLRININLFKGLAKYWEYMPSYTQKTLTGVSWSKAQPMLANDRLLGLQAGTTANMYTSLAYQQADLYTSGKFNEDQLVAAARLGIFDLAYAAPGGDVEAQQAGIYDRLYRSLYESNATEAEKQSTLSLIRQYNPNMAAYLERGHGLVEAGYTQYRNFGAFSDTRGNIYLGEQENARVSMASTGWDMNLRSFREGASLLGAKAYELSEPVIKVVERALWAAARGESIDWDSIASELGKLWDKLFGDVDFSNIDWKEKLSFLDPIIDAVKEKLKPLGDAILTAFSEFIDAMMLTKIQFHSENLLDVLEGKKSLGDLFTVVTPQSVMREQIQNIRDEISASKWSHNSNNYAGFSRPKTYSKEQWKEVSAIMEHASENEAFNMQSTKWNGKAWVKADVANPSTYNQRMAAWKAYASNEALQDALEDSDLWKGNAEKAQQYLSTHGYDAQLADLFKGTLGLSDADMISLMTLHRAVQTGASTKEELTQLASTIAEAFSAVIKNGDIAVKVAVEDLTQNGVMLYANKSKN